jgi:hypothetical protein
MGLDKDVEEMIIVLITHLCYTDRERGTYAKH